MKLYTGRDVDVSFDLSLCVHCENCLNALPAVFQLDRKPWVLPDAATKSEVIEAVGKCPSGALKIARGG